MPIPTRGSPAWIRCSVLLDVKARLATTPIGNRRRLRASLNVGTEFAKGTSDANGGVMGRGHVVSFVMH